MTHVTFTFDMYFLFVELSFVILFYTFPPNFIESQTSAIWDSYLTFVTFTCHQYFPLLNSGLLLVLYIFLAKNH